MLFRLMAPRIIPSEEKIEDARRKQENPRQEDFSENILNKIDVAIFRTYYRTSAPNTTSIIEQTNSATMAKKKINSKNRQLTTIIKKNQLKK